MPFKARIRGIYTTALTKLLIDEGFRIVDPSQKIKERFRLSIDYDEPPDINIYDRFDRQGVNAVGGDEALKTFSSILQSTLDDVIIRGSILHSYTGESTLNQNRSSEESMIPMNINRGNMISIEFPAASKRKLDELRGSVTPTVDGHHYLRACGGRMTYLLEVAEKMLESNVSRDEVMNLLKESLRSEYPRLNSKIRIEHVKIDGRIFHLGNAKVVFFDYEEGRIRLLRVFNRKGIYDGLKIPKESGDYALTDMRIGGWSFRTNYFSSDGEYKGTYINLNTPIELYPGRIRYIDLEVDVCLWPNGTFRRLDLEKLEEKIAEGYISKRLGEIVKDKLEGIIESLRMKSESVEE